MEDTRRDPSRIETARHSVGISYISRSYPSTSEQHKRGRRKHAQRGNTLIADAGPGDDLVPLLALNRALRQRQPLPRPCKLQLDLQPGRTYDIAALLPSD